MRRPARVVVTGLGAVSALGRGSQANLDAALAGRSGVARMPVVGGREVKDFLAAAVTADIDAGLSRSELSMYDRCARLAWAAADEALRSAGLAVPLADAAASEASAVFWGSGLGGAGTLEEAYDDLDLHGKQRLRPFTIIGIMTNAAAALLGLKAGFRGTANTYAAACASSAQAIGEAVRHIRAGHADRALAGGSEAMLTYGSMQAWRAMQTIARVDADAPERSCKPFSARRSGFVIGEAGAALMLESLESAQARGAPILAEIVGYGSSNDATHITRPDPAGQARAIHAALADAGLAPEAIAYVNAHGTATEAGDAAEAASLKLAFGAHASRLMVSSTKAVHGHTLGAAGALELLLTIGAMRRGLVPPTAGLDDPDPALGLDFVPQQAREAADIAYAMSNSFAFGGANAVLIVRRWDGDA